MDINELTKEQTEKRNATAIAILIALRYVKIGAIDVSEIGSMISRIAEDLNVNTDIKYLSESMLLQVIETCKEA